jgi:hypothetical protein
MAGFPNAQNNPVSAMPVYIGQSYLNTALDITEPTVVKATPGSVGTLTVVVAGSGPGTVNDCTTTGAAAAANQIATAPAQVGSQRIDFPCQNGIVVVPGPGQTLAISYA